MDLWHLHLGFGDMTSKSQKLYNGISKNYSDETKIAEVLNNISNRFTKPVLFSVLFAEIIKSLLNYDGCIVVSKDGTQVTYC
jgi:hypothetical protein